MWNTTWRNQTWQQLDQPWDLIIIGGGITGAGLLREAVRGGLRVLLVEARDFAWGTSSRSSKLVHGGLRYLATGQIGLTRDSVRERERLLNNAPGLVERLPFLLADNPDKWSDNLLYQAGLMAYDLLALNWQHRHVSAQEMSFLMPHTEPSGAMLYHDAQTDDARLVLRILREACANGGHVLNYARVTGLSREQGRVRGIELHDTVHDRHVSVQAKVVINATGAWADQIRTHVFGAKRLRPLRGSHLVFAAWRVPVAQALTGRHPVDGRPIFVLPWEGATIVGTTDLDHHQSLEQEPTISAAETSYLMQAVASFFPSLHLTLDDIISTWSGVRPVIDTGASDPSKESRDHVVWMEQGLLTVTGGKLTTFRLIAQDALRQLEGYFPSLVIDSEANAFDQLLVQEDQRVTPSQWRRLQGRYGNEAQAVLDCATEGELQHIPGTPVHWCELRWAARNEGIQHLDDLLLRRLRIGNTLPNGAAQLLPQLESMCRSELGWDETRWQAECQRYESIIAHHYSVPEAIAVEQTVAHTPPTKSHVIRNLAGIAIAGLGLWHGLKWVRR